MQDFKKALISTACGVLFFAVASFAFLKISSPYIHNYDWHLRERLSGSLDFLIAGASQAQFSLFTREIDEVIGCNSYNLSYDCEQNFEKDYLLRKELARNEIKTVVLELSYDTMKESGISNFTDANIFTIMRLDSFSDRLSFFINNVNMNNKLYVYAKLMYSGLSGFVSHQDFVDEEQTLLKGSRFFDSEDHSLTKEEVAGAYNRDRFSVSSFQEKTIEGFTDLITLCKEHGVRVIVAVAPVSDNYIWCTDNLDEFSEWATGYCKENNVEYYDFNLLKDRYNLFSDLDCYSNIDTHHMSEKGSKIFTKVFANIIAEAASGKDVSYYFYSSYEDMKRESPYYSLLSD